MEQKLLSIYIGNDVTRICEVVKRSATSITVNNATEVATPVGCVDDGYITDVPGMAEAIRGCVFGRGFTANKVVFTISSKKIANKEVTIPFVRGDKKISQILAANSSEYFPMSATGDYVFAHNLMEVYQDDEGKKCRLTAVAAPRDLVEGYYELAEELHVHVDNIDYVGNSILQLLALQMRDNSTELVLQIEKEATFVNVMSGRSVILQRSVPYGKSAVINSMMEIKKLTEKDAKTLLSNRDMLDREVTEDEYAEAVRYLISSIGRIVEYHRSRNPDRIIDGIKVFGEGSAIAGIDEVLRQELGAEVSHFQTLQGIKVSGKAYLTSETALRYLANFGAVLNPIGLTISYGKAEARASKDANKIMFVILGLAVVASIGFTTFKFVEYYLKVAARDLIQSQITEIEDVEQIANNYSAAVASYNTVDAFVKSTSTPNEKLLTFLEDLELILPKGAQVVTVVSVDGTVAFKVVAHSKEEVADIIVEIGKLEYVRNLSVPSLTEELGIDGIVRVTFEGTCGLIPDAPDETEQPVFLEVAPAAAPAVEGGTEQ